MSARPSIDKNSPALEAVSDARWRILQTFLSNIRIHRTLCESLNWQLRGRFARLNGVFELTVQTINFKKSHADSA
jgi:hypothetical protein